MTSDHVLEVLQDVEWVVGSFVSDAEGVLLLYQMPAELTEEQLRRTASRLASIVRCAELCELDVERGELSLNRYQLVLRPFRGGVLCVMVEAPVSRRALAMATTIVLERLPELVSGLKAHQELDFDDEPTSRYGSAAERGAAMSFRAAAPRPKDLDSL